MAEQNLTEYLRRQRRVNNVWPVDGGSDPVAEASTSPYHWQPETLWYRDRESGNEVCIVVYPHKVQHVVSKEYAGQTWSADGKRIGFFASDAGASATNRNKSHNPLEFTSGGVSYRRFVVNADGSAMRTQYGGIGHAEFGDGDFGWMRTLANANKYLTFGSVTVEGGNVYELWEVSLDESNVPTPILRLNTKTAPGGDDSKGTIIQPSMVKKKMKRAIDATDSYLLGAATIPDNFGGSSLTEGILIVNLSNWTIDRYWGLSRGIPETYGGHLGPLLSNSGFTSDLSSWTNASTGGGSVSFSSGAALLTAGGGTAIIRQSFTAPTPGRTIFSCIGVHAVTGGGAVVLKIGSTLGGAEYVNKTYTVARASSPSLDSGLSFSPTAGSIVYVQVEYAGGTSALVDCVSCGNEYTHHAGGLWLLNTDELIVQYPNAEVVFWKMKLRGSASDGGPLWQHYSNGSYGNDEVVPFSIDSDGGAPKQFHKSYWGHPSFSPRGDYMIFGEYNDTGGYVPGPRVVRTADGEPLISVPLGNLAKTLMPSHADYDGRHHAWDSYSDHVVFSPNYVNQRFLGMRFLYGRALSVQAGTVGQIYPIADAYGVWLIGGSTPYEAYPRPILSPDGTKVLYSTCLPMQLTPLNNLSGSSLGDWVNQSSGTGSVSVSNGVATLTAGGSGTAAIEFLATLPQKASSPFASYLVELHVESGSAPTLVVGTTSGGTDLVGGTTFTSVDALGYAGHVEGYRAAPAAFGAAANNITQAYFRIRLTAGSCQISGIRIYNTTHLGIAYAVAYYPKPPVLTGASKVSTNVRLAWSPQSHNPTTGNDAPRETKGYHVWSTTDATLLSGWTELTASAQAGLTYDHAQANGTTLFYAVTTEEHSRLESDYLSNVWRVVLDGAGAIASQLQIREQGIRGWWVASPSAPTLASSTFPPAATNSLSWTPPGDVSKVRYYNLYYSPSGPPSTTVDNRIASVPVGVNTWIDWLHDTASTANYAITSVDRYGNESGVTRADLPSTKERHRMTPYTVSTRAAMTESLRVSDWNALNVVDFNALASWTRTPPSPLFGGSSGSFAADPHVWANGINDYYMVYTSEFSGAQAISMARSTDLVTWTPIVSPQYSSEHILRGAGPAAGQAHQETAVYYKTPGGQHQIYYIGYDSEATFQSQIYRATASSIEGPYTREATPVLSFGASGSYDDAAMTSPSIVEHQGVLYMCYVAWADSPTGPSPTVINAGATSSDYGATWTKTGTISFSDIFGVEAHIEKGPDGKFYRVATETINSADALSIGVSAHPFGPYTKHAGVLVPGGVGVGEVDSITAPSLFFNRADRRAYMFYSAVAAGGFPWMTSLAIATY